MSSYSLVCLRVGSHLRGEHGLNETLLNSGTIVLCFCLKLSQDEATTFYDELNHHIFELVSSSDVNEKKGGILAIGKSESEEYPCAASFGFIGHCVIAFFPVSLIGVEGGNATRISRFANYLRNLLPSSDSVVMEMASKAMGHLSMAGDTFTAEYVEFEVKRALEWLGADRNEGRRHAAVRCIEIKMVMGNCTWRYSTTKCRNGEYPRILQSSDFSWLCVAGAGFAGARCQCAHLLFPAGAAVLRQHLLCGVGLQTGDP